MTALDRLQAISRTRALTDDETRRLSYLVKYYSRVPQQVERRKVKRRENHAARCDEINAQRRVQYRENWVNAEMRRYHCRASYRRRQADVIA